MAQLPGYTPDDFSAKEFDADVLGELDQEFAGLKAVLDAARSNLEQIQRDDTELANDSVHLDALRSEVLELMGDWNPRGDWVTATAYAVKDVVDNGGTIYICVEAHTSGTFATDLSAGKWMETFVLSDAEVEAAYNNQVAAASGAEMDAGTESAIRRVSPLLVHRAARAAPSISTQTFSIGAGEDYATINAALADMMQYRPAALDTLVTLEMATGFVMSEQVIINQGGVDLGWCVLTSVDAEVTIARSALTTSISSAFPAFAFEGPVVSPRIATQFNMDTSGTGTDRTGISVSYGAVAWNLYSGSGVKNAGGRGLDVFYGGRALFQGGDFSGAGKEGARIYAAYASLESTNVSSAATHGVSAESGSYVEAGSVDASLAGTNGFRVRNGSFIEAHGGTGTLSQAKNTVTENGAIFQA